MKFYCTYYWNIFFNPSDYQGNTWPKTLIFYCIYKFTVLNIYLQDANDCYNFFFRYVICLEEPLDKMSNI